MPERSIKPLWYKESPYSASDICANAIDLSEYHVSENKKDEVKALLYKSFQFVWFIGLALVLVKPSAFTDAKQIADHLIAKKTVVLNLETASPENKRRIIDFLVGVAYANGGSLKPVANLTYIITPYNVGFIGEDLVGELENNGVFI